MAYQNWFNQAANTSAVSSNIPPALVPSQSSVLDTQPVPSSYTTNRQTGSNISTMPQINQIMGVSTGGINTSMFPSTGPNSGGVGTGGGNAPSSWSGYSSGGSTGPSTPSGGTNNPGVTQNYNTGFFNPDVSGGNWSGVDEMDNFNSWADQQPWMQTSGNPTGGAPGQNVLGTGHSWADIGNWFGTGVGNAIFPGLGSVIFGSSSK